MLAVLAIMAVAALILFVLMSLSVLNTVMRLRMQRPETEALESQQVPNDARKLLAPGLAQLLELGFAHPAPLRATLMRMAGERMPQHALVLTHGRVPAAGYVMQLTMPDRGRLYSLYFVSRTQDGRTLVTRNRASVAGPIPQPGFITQDCWVLTWAELWSAHKRKMKALQRDPAQWQRLSSGEWLQAGGRADIEGFDLRVERGHLVDAGDITWRPSLGQALRTVGRAWVAWGRSSRGMEGDTPASRPAPVAIPGASDSQIVARLVETYENDSRQRKTSSWSNGAKWLLFFATAAAAAGSFGLSMGWEALPALLCVLLFHELGHFAAMRWAGYRDLKVFFLPFLGAAVSGRHESASAKQELIVLFAGPVPGLVLGLAALLWLPADLPGGDWWRSCALLAVTINAFNLAPIHPLDGGKIFEILLLARWPWAAFVGRMLGLAALGWLVMTMDSPVARTAVGAMLLLMTLGLAHQSREARLASALRSSAQQGGLKRDQALQTLFFTMGKVGLLKRPWPDLRVLADALLPTLTRPRLRHRERAGGLAVYAFFLVLPVLVLVFGMWSAAQRSADRSPGAGGGRPLPGLQGAGGAAGVSGSSARSTPSGLSSPSGLPGPAGGSAPQEPLLAQMEPLLAEVQQRVLTEPDAKRRWALLVSDFAPMLDSLPAEEAARLPTALALLREARRLAPTLPDPVGKQARVDMWQARLVADEAERQQLLASVIQRYDDTAAATADPVPLAEAALDWLQAARVDPVSVASAATQVANSPASPSAAQSGSPSATPSSPPPSLSRMAVIDKVMARLQGGGHPIPLLQLQEFKLETLLARGDVQPARQLAQQWLAAARGRPGSEAHVGSAQQWSDVLLVTEGPAAALQAVDQALQPLDASAAKQPVPAMDSLRRHGLWLAEAAGRSDWQRQHVQRLVAFPDANAGLPWWVKLLSWNLSGGNAPQVTLPQLERAHWRGDAAEAGKLAATVCRRPGIAQRLSFDSDGSQPMAAARTQLVNGGRRAICQRYGVPVPARS